jgi:AcrR family transcriptional regulator
VTGSPQNPDTELPSPPWTRAPRRRPARRRRDPLTQEAIVEAALAVLDADGLEGLSMRYIAKTLDTGAATLYWHVGSKDGLLDLIFDHIIGEQPVPDPDPARWQEQVREVARTMRATILRHRDVVRLSIGRVPMGPNALLYADRLLAILLAGGIPEPLAVVGQRLLFSIVNGFTMDETGQGGEPPADQPGPDEATAMVREYISSLPSDRFPHLVRVADHFAGPDRDAQFELLLDFYIDGLAHRARS